MSSIPLGVPYNHAAPHLNYFIHSDFRTLTLVVAIASPLVYSSWTMEVISPLGLDTNVVVVGEKVKILISVTENDLLGEEERVNTLPPITAVSNPSSSAVVRVGKPGETIEDENGIQNTVMLGQPARTDFLITFQAQEATQYTLEVQLNKTHIPGSPFSIVAVSHEQREHPLESLPSVSAGEPVTFTFPMSWRGGRAPSPTVQVGGPRGPCEIINKSGNDTVSFFPNQPGDYCISLLSNGGGIEDKYCIRAMTGDMGASKCYVLQTDKDLFQKPVRFSSDCKVSFRVLTHLAYGMGQLRVVARGPSEANVTVSESVSGEEEVITFQPTSPGRYTLDVLWGGYHIQDSPFSLYFKKPRSPVECKGLDLSKEVMVIGIPYRFKLSCKEATEGDIEIYCVPPSASSVKISSAESPGLFLCEIIPRESGTHQISVQLKGIHLSGSPFLVQFRRRGNARECRVEGGLQRMQSGATARFYVDTEGAGDGKLTAVAIEEATKERIVASVNRVDGGRHTVELTPGRGLECKLGVLYDGQHIPGSPFPLVFPGAASFSVHGDGVVRATVNRWSLFSVHSVNTDPGVFSVSIEGPGNINVVPTITSKGGTLFDVRYLPSVEGEYLIFVRWGEHQIPGSPFAAQCFSEESLSHYTIWRPSNRIPHNTPIEFTVEDGRSEREKLKDRAPLCVEARAQHSREVLTASTSRDNDGNVYCQFEPPDPSNYTVTVTCRGVELPGSPFKVTVPSPPRVERVRVWGEGLLDHRLPGPGRPSKFTVDTTDAGSGVLGIKASQRLHVSC